MSYKVLTQFIFENILNVNIFKTIYFNFKMLPFEDAILLPVFIYYRTELANLKGKIKINGKVRPGMIQFNNFNKELIGTHFWRSIEIKGEVEFNGWAAFGVGSRFFVGKGAKVVFGNDVILGGRTRLICEESISFGDNIRVAFETQIMDSNFHYLRNINDGKVEKCTGAISIGSNNWIGNRTSITKGTVTPDYLIVSSNSLLNRNYKNIFEPYSVVGGMPVKLLKTGFERIFDIPTQSEYDKIFNRLYFD